MTDHPEPQDDFEKLQFAIACIKDLQRQNLQFYDEVLLLQDENATLYRRMEALKAEHASEKKADQESIASLRKQLSGVRKNLVRLVMKERSSKLGEA